MLGAPTSSRSFGLKFGEAANKTSGLRNYSTKVQIDYDKESSPDSSDLEQKLTEEQRAEKKRLAAIDGKKWMSSFRGSKAYSTIGNRSAKETVGKMGITERFDRQMFLLHLEDETAKKLLIKCDPKADQSKITSAMGTLDKIRMGIKMDQQTIAEKFQRDALLVQVLEK